MNKNILMLTVVSGILIIGIVFCIRFILGGNSVTLIYQPMQCQTTPWQKWYDNKGSQLAKPIDEEIITNYYVSLSITVNNVKKINSDKIVCQACDICPTSYYYQLTTSRSQIDKLTQDGWK